MKLFVLVSALVAVTAAGRAGIKAASPFTNYGCQCDSLTFVDKYGAIQGNCKSSDDTEARWCYLPAHGYSTCTDVGHGQTSSRFPGRQWSYEACATPPPPAHGPPKGIAPPTYRPPAGCIVTKDGAGCQDKYVPPPPPAHGPPAGCKNGAGCEDKYEQPTGIKAASPFTNYGCQCDSLTFLDKYGKIQGNCKSTDQTGARWCYLPAHSYSTCTDVGHGQTSSRFPGRQWSYEACATPPPPPHPVYPPHPEYPPPAGCIGTKDGAGCQDGYIPSIETIISGGNGKNGVQNSNNGFENNNNEFENNNNRFENNNNGFVTNDNDSENNNNEVENNNTGVENNNNGLENNNNSFENNNNGFENNNNGFESNNNGLESTNNDFDVRSRINFNK